ncbi:MAG TPA: MauE/DoxX family redox-associated membrane protein [Hyphomonadaceae bacterium]|nr:MauE/DoxX family redox-associated membrane protein [Hyphomonadaceae bacterium]
MAAPSIRAMRARRHVQIRAHGRLGGYAPMIVLLAVSVAAGLAIAAGFGGAVGMSMHAIMGFLLASLALQRLADPGAFADAFRDYDLLAMRWRGYGFVYPPVQLALGLSYFAFLAPVQIYFATALLSTFSIAGALSSIHRHGLQHPRGAVGVRAPTNATALIETMVPLAMALAMLWM